MDAAAMITELNDHGFTDESTTAKVRVLQHSIWDIEGREPWPFLEDVASLTWDGTNPSPSNLPTNFRAVTRIRMTNGNRLRPVGVDEFDDLANGDYTNSSFSPVIYYFDGYVPKVWPIPQAGMTATMRYLKWSDSISDTTAEATFLIPKQYHRLIVYGALWKLYDMEDDPELAARFEGHYENALAQMRAAMWARQYDMSDHIRIVDPDDTGWND